MTRRRETGRILAALVAAAAVALLPAVARAGDGNGDQLGGVPALGEYIEEVPTATGSSPTSPPKSRWKNVKPRRAVPKAVEREIQTQPAPVRRTLREITTSTRYGATEAPKTKPQQEVRVRNEPDALRPPATEALGTVVSVATGGDDVHLTVLLILVLLGTGTAVAVAAARAFTGSRR